jgi:hypothetical protein
MGRVSKKPPHPRLKEDLSTDRYPYHKDYCAGIFKQSMGVTNRVGIRVVVPAHMATQPGGIDSSNRFLRSLKVKIFGLCSFLVKYD